MAEHMRPEFPLTRWPDDNRARGFAGLYPQREEGRYMQRLKVLGGRLTAPEWRGLADLLERRRLGHPLHLTTRQDVELHGVDPQMAPELQAELADLGLSCLGACGDTLRNVTVCPGAGLCRGSRDLAPLAWAIRRVLEAHPRLYDLPRKFKISISGCKQSCAMPWISDLGFVEVGDGKLRAIGAGSLGARPRTGIELYDGLESADCVALALAGIELLLAEGERTNRRRARLRHVRERLGDDEFRRRLEVRFTEQRSRADIRVPGLEARSAVDLPSVQLRFPAGDVTVDQARLLARTAEETDAAIRIDLEHGIRLYGIEAVDLPGELAALADQPCVMSCPGADLCAHAIAHSRHVAAAVRKALPAGKGNGLAIKVSGCPNGCAHSAVADIGLVAGIRRRDGRKVEFYQIMVGGEGGRGPRLAEPIGEPIAKEAVASVVVALAGKYTGGSRSWDHAEATLRGLREANS